MEDFGALYNEYKDMIYKFLFRLSRNESLAEELCQETFYQAIKAYDKFRGDSSISTWLCGIAKRLYYSNLKQNKTVPLEENSLASPDIAEEILQSDRRMMAQKILHELQEPYKEIFTLRTFCDLSHKQIGELFGKSESWARVCYYRARQMLILAIEREEKE